MFHLVASIIFASIPYLQNAEDLKGLPFTESAIETTADGAAFEFQDKRADILFPIFGRADQKELFGFLRNNLTYFHSHSITSQALADAAHACTMIEIDLAWAHSAFHPSIVKGEPYIGHPEEFYTLIQKPFPINNVGCLEFQDFLKTHPLVKVLIDIKDATVFPYLEEFVKEVGRERCIVHAFIANWTIVPPHASVEPHWYREDIDLFVLDALLCRLGVPLIANCRGFSDSHVSENGVIQRMIEDAKQCKSIVSLGLYYPGAPLPKIEFLEEFHHAGYYAWVNGNIRGFQEKIGKIRYIAMSDDMKQCTTFSIQ